MVIRQSRKRVAICLPSAQDLAVRKWDRARVIAEKTGDVVATYISTLSSSQVGEVLSHSLLIDMMVAANGYEFDVVVADLDAVCAPPWDVDRVVARLQELGIDVIEPNASRMVQPEWILRALLSDTKSRDHGRRIRARIGSARARRAAAAVGHDAGQTSSDGA